MIPRQPLGYELVPTPAEATRWWNLEDERKCRNANTLSIQRGMFFINGRMKRRQA